MSSIPNSSAATADDIHSYGNPDQVRVTHVGLLLDVSFESRAIGGMAFLTVERAPGAPPDAPLVLDTRGLKISGVFVGNDKALFELGKEDPIKGSSLNIKLPPGTTSVSVAYTTTKNSTALQWLDAKGTAGGKHPFLFTQSQAIHARSWIPIQDSPGVRITYDATIQVPQGLVAVMSADGNGTKPTPAANLKSFFSFSMKEPIPAYLIALAVGDLAFKPLGPRTGVFAEPRVVDSAAKEFADTEAMVSIIEKRFGPYRWGRYDLLVLPPSFPFGGMENPRLTFATPTVIAGDRSLVSLVAHELAHSWSGNLVTNATWRDFWLNEGFTTYLERRVLEDLYGKERVDMERMLGRRELNEEIAEFAPKDQILHIDLAGRDPGDGMTRIPYEKGSLFLETLEATYGRDRFDTFLKDYFNHFAFKSITTADFLAYLKKNLIDVEPKATEPIDLVTWINKPGLPSKYPPVSSDRFAKVEKIASEWSVPNAKIDAETAKAWTTHEWVHFLQSLPKQLPAEQMTALDSALGLTSRGNAEVAEQWLVIAIRNGYAPADARLENFLTSIGRRKFLMPLYGELNKTPDGAKKANRIFAKARPFYHPISADSVAKLLGVEKTP